MPDKRPDKKHGGYVAVLVAVLFLLPVLYVVSIGPAVWLRDHSFIIQETIDSSYAPLIAAMDHWHPLRTAIQWYCRLWGPEVS